MCALVEIEKKAAMQEIDVYLRGNKFDITK